MIMDVHERHHGIPCMTQKARCNVAPGLPVKSEITHSDMHELVLERVGPNGLVPLSFIALIRQWHST